MTKIDTNKVTAGSKTTTPVPSITQQLAAKVAAGENKADEAAVTTETTGATGGVEVVSVAPEVPETKNETIVETSVVPEATKAVEAVKKMVTDVPLPNNTPEGVCVFISPYPSIEVGIDMMVPSERDSKALVRTSKNIVFSNGIYRTANKNEIEQLRKIASTSVHIKEQKTTNQSLIVEQTNKAMSEQRQRSHAGLATSANGGSDSELSVHAALSDMQKKALR